MSDEDAIKQLHELLELNTKLFEAQHRANELKERELDLQSQALKIEQGKIELEKQNKALQKEALNRAEKRLQEVIQRYVGLAERVEILLNYAQKNLFKDDAFKDMLAQLSERFETFELAIMLALMDKLESPQIQEKVGQVVDKLQGGLNKASKQRQLASYYKNLNRLEEQKAEGDDDLNTLNKIDTTRENIARLEQELGYLNN